jgi:hypothetical protein
MSLMRQSVFRLSLVLLAGAGVSCGPRSVTFPREPVASVVRPARVHPDYRDLWVPPNLAPLNFVIDEPGQAYAVRIRGANGSPIEVTARAPGIRIPEQPWRTLLGTNLGGPIYFDMFVQDPARGWQRFATSTNQVAREPIDATLVYRFLKPLYNFYAELGIYQRSLEGFDVKPVLENRDFGGRCLNCHTFLDRRPDQFALHIRGVPGAQPMLLVQSNAVTRVDKTAGYLSWHPSGRLLAFSANKLSLFFHTQGETRDVFDAESNLGLYWVTSNFVASPPPIAQSDRLETWPSWSPDGRFLYFCSAPKLRRERYRQVRYDLMRIGFDIDNNRWGEPERLVSAADTGLSAAQPRVSPDGRWLLFCLAKHGHFPVYQPSSDLYLMDLTTRQFRRLEINSDQADSWHCWSGNSRWVVFSSKRGNGLFARPHFAHVDDAGRFSKPFVLPQSDPAFYDACVQTFNVPEFVRGPVQVSPDRLARAILRPERFLNPGGDFGQAHREEQGVALPPGESNTGPQSKATGN